MATNTQKISTDAHRSILKRACDLHILGEEKKKSCLERMALVAGVVSAIFCGLSGYFPLYSMLLIAPAVMLFVRHKLLQRYIDPNNINLCKQARASLLEENEYFLNFALEETEKEFKQNTFLQMASQVNLRQKPEYIKTQLELAAAVCMAYDKYKMQAPD